jgi:hypothetical protein
MGNFSEGFRKEEIVDGETETFFGTPAQLFKLRYLDLNDALR